MSAQARQAGATSRELELALLAGAAIILGPLAVGLGFALRLLRRRVLVLGAIPSAGAGLLLWSFVHRHLHAALRILHGQLRRHPHAALLAALHELWPAWLAAAVFAPLIALVLSLRPASPRFPVDTGEPRGRGLPLAERRAAARAANPPPVPPDGDGLFLGYGIGGDPLLPMRRGRVHLPLSRLARHLLVAGSTGSGKTETVLRIADSLARRSDWAIVFVDGKGDRETMARFRALMTAAGREVWCFPDRPYDGWRGSGSEIADRLLQLIDFASEGGGAYYRDLAVHVIRLACNAPSGPPRSSADLLARLSRPQLFALYPKGSSTHAELASVPAVQFDGIRARYAAFFATVGGSLDGETALEELDTAYLLLDGLRLKWESGYLARFLVEEFTQWAVGRKPRVRRVLLVVDEFSAIARAGAGLVDVVERTRGFGVAAILCPQLAEGMGGSEAAARIIGSAQTILLHQMATPEPFVTAAGSRRVHATTRQLQGDGLTGLGSTRVALESRLDPDAVRRLHPGQCFAIGSGLVMKLQITAAPAVSEAAVESG